MEHQGNHPHPVRPLNLVQEDALMVTEPGIVALTRKIEALEQEAENCHATIAALRESVERYSSLIDNVHDLIHSVTPQGAFLFVNRAWRELLGYSQDEIKKLTLFDIVDESCRDKCRASFSCLKQGEKPACPSTGIFLTKDGGKIPMEGRCSAILQDGEAVAMTGIFRDITQRKRAEDALELACKEMEHKVAVQMQNLSEANICLEVMLKQYDLNKKQLEQQILRNLSEKVSPVIERLKKSGLRDSQKKYIEVVEANIKEILSPCGPGIGLTLARLTSTEKTVANLVKQGKNTKEIAAFLQVATGTVNKHRENIRKKIGVTHKKQSLEKTLLSII